jgi:hypothetical protein
MAKAIELNGAQRRAGKCQPGSQDAPIQNAPKRKKGNANVAFF